MPIYSIDKAYLSYAIGTDLSAWDNAYDPLIAGECQVGDKLDPVSNQIGIDYSDPETMEVGLMSTAQYPIQITTGNKIASVVLPMYLQTGVFMYVTLGTSSTGGGPPYTHPVSLNSSQTPINLALHFEKQLSGEDLRYDFFGFMPDFWRVLCGEDKARWKAQQVFSGKFAKSDDTASHLEETSKQSLSIYEWNDLKHGSGLCQVKYGGDDLEFTIYGFDLKVVRRNPLWGARNAEGFPGEASIAGCYIELLVDGYVTGDNIRTIMKTKPEDYANDINADFKFYKSADREFPIDINKLYLVPDNDILSQSDWYEKKTLKFVPYNGSTSITGAPKDSLDKTYYEND